MFETVQYNVATMCVCGFCPLKFLFTELKMQYETSSFKTLIKLIEANRESFSAHEKKIQKKGN